MTTTKTQEKKQKFIKPEWLEETKAYAIEGGKVVLQGMLFSFGGFCTNKLVTAAANRKARAIIKTASNVVEMKSKTA